MPSYRFGKHPPKHDYRTLRFKNYLMRAIAPPPASDNVLARVYAKLKVNDPTKLFECTPRIDRLSAVAASLRKGVPSCQNQHTHASPATGTN